MQLRGWARERAMSGVWAGPTVELPIVRPDDRHLPFTFSEVKYEMSSLGAENLLLRDQNSLGCPLFAPLI